ncbi:alpha/beta hydrolase family protein [Perlucidibaca piscinae]|uniref:alpha/beta hydrolase family protein n=1 Tax=Perlucidibaca piscinae TaxID=392589 RepID=UPI0003B7705A|nr:hypothetical protein [Perlucidibaca piscinae]
MSCPVARLPLLLAISLLTACGSENDTDTSSATSSPVAAVELTPAGPADPLAPVASAIAPDAEGCGSHAAGTPGFIACEQANFAKVSEAPREQLSNPLFLQRLTAQSLSNSLSLAERLRNDPSYLPFSTAGVSANTPLTPLCTSWALPCVGDPFRYPEVDPFYRDEAEVTPVVFYDRECARLSGRVWRPLNARGTLPAVVIQNGSVQAPEPLYWWMAQAAVRAGYVVLTFDPRGQGRSDQQTPAGGQGSNANPAVFWEGLVDAIDFFRSTPVQPYPHNLSCAGTYPTPVTAFNPQHAVQDRDRLGLVGHSLGATGVSIVQGYGAPGADPWPGLIDSANPVDVVVAWDGPLAPDGRAAGGANGNLPSLAADARQTTAYPAFGIRVPLMGQNGEYGLVPLPFTEVPDRAARLGPFLAWQEAGMPVIDLTLRGSSHYEWSLIPGFPASSWCPEVRDGRCRGGWGRPLAEHYTLAWLDRWLKRPGERGHDDADARLLDDARFRERLSFHFDSRRDFPQRDGQRRRCNTIRTSCQ